MFPLIVSWILNAVALYATMYFVPGLSIRTGTQGYIDAFIGALILTAMNKVIRPIIFLLTLPINLLTLGLFTFVVMGFTFCAMTWFAPGIKSAGFLPCVIGAVVFGVLNWMLH